MTLVKWQARSVLQAFMAFLMVGAQEMPFLVVPAITPERSCTAMKFSTIDYGRGLLLPRIKLFSGMKEPLGLKAKWLGEPKPTC